MKIDVCFSPALYPVYHNPEAIVVVVDVFRATTTMAAAFSNGVSSIRPVATVEEAEAYKAKGWLVGAERNVKRCEFADFGNSPFDYTSEKVFGKDIVFATTNGTRAITLFAQRQGIAGQPGGEPFRLGTRAGVKVLTSLGDVPTLGKDVFQVEMGSWKRGDLDGCEVTIPGTAVPHAARSWTWAIRMWWPSSKTRSPACRRWNSLIW